MCNHYLYKGKPFLKYLELKTCGTMIVTLKMFIVEFGQESRFLFYHACTEMKNRSPTSLQHPTLSKKHGRRRVCSRVMSIFKKSWSFWRQVWVASSLLKQILRNNSKEVPSNWPIIFVQTLTTTQPKEIKGKRGQEPQHNPVVLRNCDVRQLVGSWLGYSLSFWFWTVGASTGLQSSIPTLISR